MKEVHIDKNLIRSFGRINGRKLRVGQSSFVTELLPKFAVNINASDQLLKPADLFLNQQPIYMEIGFGYGEHLLGLALRYKDINFIGCEPFLGGVANLLKLIDEHKLENIRILRGDARILIDKLPSNCIKRLFILFPDPWPKTKQHKKRIITTKTLQEFARILEINGRLEIATDHVDYGKWIAKHLSASDQFTANESIGASNIPEDWVETRYQQKAAVCGRAARFFNYTYTSNTRYGTNLPI